MVVVRCHSMAFQKMAKGSQASSRGRAGGLAELCCDGDGGKFDEINYGNFNSQQVNETVSVLSRNVDAMRTPLCELVSKQANLIDCTYRQL